MLLVARHEIRQAWRSQALVAFALVAAGLFVTAALFSSARLSRDVDARARYQAVVADQWRDQPDRHPHRVAHYGFLLFRPMAPLSVFDPGVDRFTGTSLFLEAHRANFANFTDATESDALLRVGDLSPAMVAQLILPLFVFVLVAVSVAREREQGTAALLRCQGASWAELLGGKVAGTLTITLLVIAPALVVSILIVVGGQAPDGWAWNGGAAGRLAGLVVAHALYFVSLGALAAVLAASQRTMRGALVTVLSVWIVVMVVVPRVVPALAATIYPVPARSTFTAEVERHIRRLGDGHNPNDPRFAALRAETLATHGVSRVEDLPFNYNGLVSTESERLTTQANREELARIHGIYRRQQAVVRLAGVVSPYLALRSVSMALSGGDLDHAMAFEAQAEDYRFALVQYLNDLHTHEVEHARDRYVESAGDTVAPSRQRIDRAHFAGAPVFEPQAPTWGAVVRAQTWPLVSLSIWAGGLLLTLARAGRWAGSVRE